MVNQTMEYYRDRASRKDLHWCDLLSSISPKNADLPSKQQPGGCAVEALEKLQEEGNNFFALKNDAGWKKIHADSARLQATSVNAHAQTTCLLISPS